MKLETLQRDWQASHPGGNVWIVDRSGALSSGGQQTGKFAVTYTGDGKLYTYTAKSVYAIAERLGMIPVSVIDNWAESHAAIATIRSGGSYRSLDGLSDTMRYILAQETGKDYDIDCTSETDEYDRTVMVYTGIRECQY